MEALKGPHFLTHSPAAPDNNYIASEFLDQLSCLSLSLLGFLQIHLQKKHTKINTINFVISDSYLRLDYDNVINLAGD